jgi:hypothetical protein
MIEREFVDQAGLPPWRESSEFTELTCAESPVS